MTRREAAMIAEELFKLLRKDLRNAVFEATVQANDRLLTVKEVAEILGWSTGTVYNKIKELPHTKAGKRLIFSEKAIHEWLWQKDSLIR